MKQSSKYIAGIPNYYFGLLEEYFRKHIIVYFEHEAESNKLDYRFDLPHRKYKSYLSEKETQSLISCLKNLDSDNVIKYISFMQVEGEVLDLLVLIKKHPEKDNTAIGVMFDIGNIVEFRPNIQFSQKQLIMGQLAMGVAHDISNQLTILYGMLSRLEESGTVSKELTSIRKATDSSAYILKQITDFSHNDKHENVVDMYIIVQQCIELFSYGIGNDIEVSYKCSARNTIILGNNTMIQSAILNILLNAKDAMPNGGRITFSIYNKTYENGDRNIEIEISDNGEGIDKKVLPYIFQMFYTTKDVGKGTGLGLTLAKNTINDHKGNIKAQSQKGKGTIITISLPLLCRKEDDMPVLNYAVVCPDVIKRLLLSNYIRKQLNGECATFPSVKRACDYYVKNDDNINILLYCIKNDESIEEQWLEKLKLCKPFLRIANINRDKKAEENIKEIQRYLIDNFDTNCKN